MREIEIPGSAENLSLRYFPSQYTSGRGTCPICRREGETLIKTKKGWLFCTECDFQHSYKGLKERWTRGCKYPAYWQAVANKCMHNVKIGGLPYFVQRQFHIPMDERAPIREFFFDNFMGTATRSLIWDYTRNTLRPRLKHLRGPDLNAHEPCITIPMYEDFGKIHGILLRSGRGGEAVICSDRRRKNISFLCQKPSVAFREVKGFGSLIKDGAALSVAARTYTLVFEP